MTNWYMTGNRDDRCEECGRTREEIASGSWFNPRHTTHTYFDEPMKRLLGGMEEFGRELTKTLDAPLVLSGVSATSSLASETDNALRSRGIRVPMIDAMTEAKWHGDRASMPDAVDQMIGGKR